MTHKGWRFLGVQWLLLLAIGLQGLGPAFAGLMPGAAADRLQIVVCTSAGIVIMDVPADGQDTDNSLRIHKTGECLLCGGPPALPPTLAPWRLLRSRQPHTPPFLSAMPLRRSA
ncbi:DUF2946 family protein [Neopusillimonas aromaticivorans]|uniref:DUF2946 family protein n=1 Tax=Neopusillimonas aromaticivorans TaxID=2979868 RepID=UPI00259637AB|nr:DUF2946 family protein [Neopusillimonas aromaticivorans]WJJ92992.1 DUF2946 family protein [Neopusillimonas aromaticivorans]